MPAPTSIPRPRHTASGLLSTRQNAFNPGYLQVGRNGRFL